MLSSKSTRRMVKNLNIGLFTLLVLAAPPVVMAAEPAWWTQQKSKCGLSSSLAYNTWVSQGSPCNSGARSSNSTSGGSIGTIIGTEIGKELGKALFGDAEADARRKEQAQIRAEEQRRAAEEAERKLEEQKNRLMGGMMGVDNSAPLGFMGVDSGSELILMTDQAEPTPSFDRYKSWEKYKRDVLAYQELLTQHNSKNKENQNWCKGHIPLSMGPNSANWESRCNPNGHVKFVDVGSSPAPKTEPTAKPVVTALPMVKAAAPAEKAPATFQTRPDEQAKPAPQGGLGLKDLMLGETGAPKTPEAFPVVTEPVAAPPKPKEPTITLTSDDETVKAAAQSGFDTKGPLNGAQSVEPKIPQALPVVTTPAVAKAAVTNKMSTPLKYTPKVERHVMAANQAVPSPISKKEPSSPSQKAVVEKQVQALSCAIKELQGLARGMDSEGTPLQAELKSILNDIREGLNKPCSGQIETKSVQTFFLGGLTKGAKNKEDHLEGSILVTRDEKSCEVHLDVQYASSIKSASSFRSSGQQSNENQSIIHLDKTGKIIAAESPVAVEKCLAPLSE